MVRIIYNTHIYFYLLILLLMFHLLHIYWKEDSDDSTSTEGAGKIVSNSLIYMGGGGD